MAERVFMAATEAMAEAALRAGCQLYAGYPITPSRELLEFCARRMPELGRVCMLAESELEAVNIVYGAAASGARVMTASSHVGISLMQECFSAMAMAELPCVVLNLMRHVLQGDYWQATRGGGHEDYRWLVLSPETTQEAVDLTFEAFNMADRYRIPVMILGDYVMAHAMESVVLPEPVDKLPAKDWALTGAKGRQPYWIGYDLSPTWPYRQEKYTAIAARETRVEKWYTNDADLIVVAFGTACRFVKPAIAAARKEGIKVGLIRPITLYPFPSQVISETTASAKDYLVIELNDGQMVEDVKLAVNGARPVHFRGAGWEYECRYYSHYGALFSPDEVLEQIRAIIRKTG